MAMHFICCLWLQTWVTVFCLSFLSGRCWRALLCNLPVLPEGRCVEYCRHMAACSYLMCLWLHKGKINLFQLGHSNGLCFNSSIYFPEPLQERELAKAQTWKNESSVYCSVRGTGWSWYLYSLLKVFSGLDYLPMWFLVSDSHWLYQYSHICKLRGSRKHCRESLPSPAHQQVVISPRLPHVLRKNGFIIAVLKALNLFSDGQDGPRACPLLPWPAIIAKARSAALATPFCASALRAGDRSSH